MKSLMIVLTGSALLAAPAFAQAGAQPGAAAGQPAAGAAQPATGAAGATAAPGAGANVTVGATVSDTSGAPVGTIESVSGGNAVLSTGTAKASLPVSSFAKGANGLVVGITKSALEAQVAAATTPQQINVGAAISDAQGGAVGKVAAVSGDMITVQTANSKAQLPKSAFAQGPNGLVIGMTAAQLDAAAKAAGAQATSASK